MFLHDFYTYYHKIYLKYVMAKTYVNAHTLPEFVELKVRIEGDLPGGGFTQRDSFHVPLHLLFLFSDRLATFRTLNYANWALGFFDYMDDFYLHDLVAVKQKTVLEDRKFMLFSFVLLLFLVFIYGPFVIHNNVRIFLKFISFKIKYIPAFLFNKEYNRSVFGLIVFDSLYDAFMTNNFIDEMGMKQFHNVTQ